MPFSLRLCGALAVALLALPAVQAQSARSVPNVSPSATARAAQVAPNPSGLRPLFPAGISSGSGASQAADPIAR